MIEANQVLFRERHVGIVDHVTKAFGRGGGMQQALEVEVIGRVLRKPDGMGIISILCRLSQ